MVAIATIVEWSTSFLMNSGVLRLKSWIVLSAFMVMLLMLTKIFSMMVRMSPCSTLSKIQWVSEAIGPPMRNGCPTLQGEAVV